MGKTKLSCLIITGVSLFILIILSFVFVWKKDDVYNNNFYSFWITDNIDTYNEYMEIDDKESEIAQFLKNEEMKLFNATIPHNEQYTENGINYEQVMIDTFICYSIPGILVFPSLLL